MADVKDILGVPRGGAPAEKKDKKEQPKLKRPKGMSREAFALMGGSHPILPSQMIQELQKKKKDPLLQLKSKPSSKGTVIFRLKPLRNPARQDKLELVHWVKGYKDAKGVIKDTDDGDYPFAKYNKKALVYRYDGEEWESLLREESGGWSREETDYLMDLVERFDARFVIVADRYNYPGGQPRSMEDIKERYYQIARKLLVAREGTDATVAHHPLVKFPYNAAHERARKAALMALLARDPREEEEENTVLEAARVVEERRRADAAASAAANAAAAAAARKAALPAPGAPRAAPAPEAPFDPADLIYPLTFSDEPPPGAPTLLGVNLEPHRPAPGVYARGTHTRETAQLQATTLLGNSTRHQKMLEAALVEVDYPAFPRHNTRSVSGAFLALRGELLHMLEARRQLQARQAPPGTKRKGGSDGGARGEKRQRVAKRFD